MTTALLLHFDGADGSTSIIDSGSPAKTVTAYNGAQINGNQLLLDGVNDYVQSDAYTTDFQPSGNWTAEGWLTADATLQAGGIFCLGSVASETSRMQLYMGADGTLNFYVRQGGSWFGPLTTVTGVVVAAQKRHFAVTKVGTVFNIYYNGSRRHTWDFGFSTNSSNGVMYVGVDRNQSSGALRYFKGKIDDFRFDKSTALYTGSSYTVPSQPLALLGIADLAGDAAATASASAHFTGQAPLSGSAAGVATASGDLAHGVPLAGAATASASATGTVSEGFSAPTLLVVSNPVGDIVAPITLVVTESGDITAPVNLAVIEDITTVSEVTWSSACTIDGADVSVSLVGVARVIIAEGAARVAQVSIRPPSGSFSPLDYVGKTIAVDYVWGAAVRLFTGWIDTPDYDPNTGILALTCSDDMQNRVAAMELADIEALIDGVYSADVQGEIGDRWDYAQALLSTVQASLDAGPNGDLRMTLWQVSGGASFSGSSLLYLKSRLTLPTRSTIVNQVQCTFKFRYPRLRQRNASLGWSGTHIDMAPAGYRYPTQNDFYGAAGGSGWFVTLGVFWPAPASIPHSSGGFIYPDEGSIDMAVLQLAHRHAQTVTETWNISYYAPLSIDINGQLSSTLTGAVESAFDGRAWESAVDVEPLIPGGGELDMYDADTDLLGRAENAKFVLEQIATTKIIGSHRSARVSNATLLNPALDVNMGASISTDGMSASGKVVEVIHTMDFDSGSAISEFSIACFALGGTGTPPPHFPANPIAGHAEGTQDWQAEVTQLSTNVFGITSYSDDLMGILINPPEFITVHDVPDIGTKAYPNPSYTPGSYPVTGFRIRMPGVSDADRNPIDLPAVDQAWELAIPEGTLSFTVP